jgi:SAM-dependent methyltransferase
MRPDIATDSRYWDRIAREVQGYYLPKFLAEYKGRQYLDLLDRWQVSTEGRLLVTDLYEAAFGDPELFRKLACGGGLVTMDISPVICRAGMQHLKSMDVVVQAVCCDSRALPFKQDCFDVIISPSTFDHFPELNRALTECRRVSAPNGRLLLALNSSSNPFFKIGVRLAEFFKKKEYETDYFYTAARSREELALARFKNGRQTGIMHLPVGATTLIERSGSGRGSVAIRRFFEVLLYIAERFPDRIKLLTGWWVVSEGIK